MSTAVEKRKLLALTGMLFCLTVVIFFPGFFSEDSIAQLEEARSGLYSDGNPPLMAFMWRYIDQIYKGQAGMLILQLIAYWTGLYLIVVNFSLTYKRRIIFLICVGLFPATLGILGTIWKDVLMMAFGVLGIGLGMAALNKKSKLYLITAVVSFSIACSMRQNGIFVLPPILVGILYSFFYDQKTSPARLKFSILAAIAGTVLFIIINSFITYELFQSKKTHLWRLLPLFDLAGIYYHIDKVPEQKLPPFATSSFSIQTLRAQYTARSLMPVVLPLCLPDKSACNPPPFFDIALKPGAEGRQQIEELKKHWLSEVLSHPQAYATHRLKAFSHLLGIHGSLWGPVYFMGVKNNIGLDVQTNFFQKACAKFLQLLTRVGLFNAYFYLILNIVILIQMRKRHSNREGGFVFGIALSALFFELAYLLITPSMDYRYSYWFIVATIICSYLHFFKEKEKANSISI